MTTFRVRDALRELVAAGVLTNDMVESFARGDPLDAGVSGTARSRRMAAGGLHAFV